MSTHETPTTITLTRTGQAPLRFDGAAIAQAGGPCLNGRDLTRWHELSLYRTGRGNDKYVLAIAFRTRWQGECDHSIAEILPSTDPVVATLKDYDPLSPAAPFPPGAGYLDRQQRLERDLRIQYDDAVSDLLGQVANDFAETIDP